MAINVNKPVQLADGRKARIVCTDRAGDFPIMVLLRAPDDCEEIVCSFNQFGESRFGSKKLINVPKETVEFINYYGDGKPAYTAETLDFSTRVAGTSLVARFKLTRVDGKVTKVELA